MACFMLKSCFMVRQKFAHASSHQERRKSPMIARYTWLAIMVAAMICADQRGVAKQQINHLLAITIMYGVSVELTKRLMAIRR